MTGSRRRTGGDRGSWHPPVAPWLRIAGAVAGVVILVLTVTTVAVQAYQANSDRDMANYSRVLTEWEDCRIDAVVQSGVTDELIDSIKGTNEAVRRAPTFEASKRPRNALTDQLGRLQNQREQAKREQATCGPKPARPDGSPS